jgi:hypothetical protein
VVAGIHDPSEHVAHFGLIVDQPQQGLASRPRNTDAEDVFRGGVEIDDQQAAVYEDDGRAEAVEQPPRRALAFPAARSPAAALVG